MSLNGRFTELAQRALMYSQEEARAMGHNYVGTEHLLLGLLKEGEGAACQVLNGLGIDIDSVRLQIEGMVGKGDFIFNEGFGYTPRTKRVLEMSFYEARNLGHNYVGTEHMLLALIREGEGVGAKAIIDLGINLQQVQDQIIKQLKEESVESPKPVSKNSNTPTLN